MDEALPNTDGQPDDRVVRMRAFGVAVKSADAVLLVTPENNRTVPACLKNAVAIGSKPNADVAWKNLPAGIISRWAATRHKRTCTWSSAASICNSLVSPRSS